MKVECYLRIKAQRSGYGTDVTHERWFKATELKVSRSKPKTEANEIAVKLNLQIPNALFVKPDLVFNVEIPENAAVIPPITAEVKDNLVEVLSKQIGQTVHLSVTGDE